MNRTRKRTTVLQEKMIAIGTKIRDRLIEEGYLAEVDHMLHVTKVTHIPTWSGTIRIAIPDTDSLVKVHYSLVASDLYTVCASYHIGNPRTVYVRGMENLLEEIRIMIRWFYSEDQCHRCHYSSSNSLDSKAFCGLGLSYDASEQDPCQKYIDRNNIEWLTPEMIESIKFGLRTPVEDCSKELTWD